ncbi:MAG: glycoside hydrolase family 16 protein [Bacteroidetes bacterium]|nr:glycoside hydrolase family 16 protein [Bacteroidota bacterium]
MKATKSLVSSLLVVVLMVSFWGCDEDDLGTSDWQLVWEQEFDGSAGASVDAAQWNYDIGTGVNGWGNNELQYYSDRAENVSLDGSGNLGITAREESYMGSGYTSGRISTKVKFDQAYGRFEASIQLPFGQGIWPAFWLLGSDIDQVSWPQCGEIDVMEYRGQAPTIVHGSLHGPGYSGGNPVTQSYELTNDRFDTDFHLFAVEWFDDRIDFFVDGNLFQRVTPDDVSGEWAYDHPFYIILNVAVGGGFVGPPNAGTPFPQTMLVDYVRVYKDMS